MQFDSTPQFNPGVLPTTSNKPGGESAPHSLNQPSGALQSRAQLGQFHQPSSTDTINEVSSFNYPQQQQQPQTFRQQNSQANLNLRPDPNQEIEKIRDNLSKIEMLQHAIQGGPHQQQPPQPQKSGLQAAGI